MSDRVFFSYLNEKSGIMDIFMKNYKKYSGALTLAQEVLREPSSLSPKDREIIAAYTSKINGCRYCHGSHEEFSKSLGASDSDANRLGPILKYVKKLTLSPSSLTKSDYDQVLDNGFTEEELDDAIAVCAAFNFYNRIVEGHGIQPQQNYVKDNQMINSVGYDQRYS